MPISISMRQCFDRAMKFLLGTGVALVLLSSFVNCSSYSEGDAFENSSTGENEDPSSMTAKVVLSSQMRNIDTYVDEDQIQFGGDCFAGLYNDNFIEYSMQNQATKFYEVLSNNTGESPTVRTDAKCNLGHFYVIIPTVRVANMTPGDIYRISLRMVSIDSTGQKVYSNRSETAIVTVRQ